MSLLIDNIEPMPWHGRMAMNMIVKIVRRTASVVIASVHGVSDT